MYNLFKIEALTKGIKIDWKIPLNQTLRCFQEIT